jgi:hypothetical protein
MANPAWKFYPTDEFLKLPRDPDPWLIKPLVPAAGWVSLYGEPKKARKSYLALGMANAVGDRSVKDWLGFNVVKHGHVLYVQVDTPHDVWAKRIADIKSGDYGYSFKNVWHASIQYMPYPFNIAEHEDILATMVQDVTQQAGEQPVFIIYDTARKMHALDENSSQDMTLFMSALENVAGRDKAKLIISHQKKYGVETNGKDEHEAEGGDLMKGMRGSGAVVGAADTIIKMSPKGNMYFQGRAVGESHKKLSFEHVHKKSPCAGASNCMGYVWVPDEDPTKVAARRLLNTYASGSIRSLAKLLATERGIELEAARSILSRMPEAQGRKGAETVTVETPSEDTSE